MKTVFFVLFLLSAAIAQNKQALLLLDSVKTIYGNPCEIAVHSPIIDRLRAYESEYVVRDYLSQFDKLVSALSACTVKKTLSGNLRVNLDKLIGREQNAVNAALLAYQSLGAVTLDLAFINGDIRSYYGKEHTFTPLNPVFALHYSLKSPFYEAIFWQDIKLK
ncbi:MAG: hypothetical protein L6Q47_02225 [Ignavibacteriaceae bacterium]|nr:hypothetical protein [Ignavibacteriaceae bacterium]